MGGEKKWYEHIVENYDSKQISIEIDSRLITANSAK